MKNYIFTLILIFSFSFTFSQVTNEGEPKSWALNYNYTLQEKVLPSFDLDQVKSEDQINDSKPGTPWRFGYSHSVDYGFDDGQWTELENGDRIWRILISSPDALSLNFIFDDFYMPQGASMYLYNNDQSDLIGAYTSVQNQESGMLGTWLVKGEKVWIEYYEPLNVKDQGRIHLAKATHGYRDANGYNDPSQKDLNDSDDCNMDVDCPIGDDWELQKNHNKRSVGLLLMNNSLCSGALINNTENDGTPYFLTAEHCTVGENASTFSFLFGWISPSTSCATVAGSQSGPMNMTISGSTKRAEYAPSDFSLLEINQSIPTGWDRVFAGWDRSGTIPDFTVAIHHPGGDVMKFARDNQSPDKINYSNPLYVWEIKDAFGGWDLGITESGSSGSPLFDHNGRIIGQEYGGQSACSLTVSTTDNGLGDIFGRMDVNWTGGGQSVSRASDWLDPNGTEVLTVNAYPSVLTLDLSLVSIDSPMGTAEFTDSELVTITIQNGGSDSISNFDLSVQVDSGDTITETYSGTLSPGESDQFTFGQSFDLSDAGSHEITVTGILDGDESLSNNTLTTTINTIGEADCPDEYDLPIVWRDNFECYTPFAIDNIGEWIINDLDQGTTWGANAVDFENESYVGAGIVFNYPLAESPDGSDISNWNTYEGNQGLYFFASGAGSIPVTPNDDWMISPEFTIDGVSSPQLSFWAKSITDQYGLERIQVAVGNSSDYNDFSVMSAGEYVEVPTDWTQFEYDLSAYEGQTIRIAIHYVSNDSFALQMDAFKVEGTLGLDDYAANNINYFYNQVTRELEITSTEIIKNIQIVSLLGQTIITDNINDLTYKINLANLSSSIYVVNVEGNSGMKTFKLQTN